MWIVEVLADAKLAGVAILSNYGLEVNGSKVLAVVGVAGISWEAVAKTGVGIRVIGGVASSIGTASAALASVTRAFVLSGLDLSGAGSALSTMVPS